jgi:hypothetical protein
MKFYSYLNEQLNEEDIIIDFIKKNCKPFIKEYEKFGLSIDKNEFLYSGRRDKSSYTIRKVRKDRKPSDTPEIIHN